MEQCEYKEKLRVQLREAYGRIVYTYTTHRKYIDNLTKRFKLMKCVQIILSSISTGGFLATVIFNKIILAWISGVVSVILLALNLYFKDFNLIDEIKQHQVVSDKLWLVREKYISLLTDLDIISTAEIVKKRDKLQNEVAYIYSKSPKTDSKSYKQAQTALKKEEEQFFTSEEIDKILPEQLRNVK